MQERADAKLGRHTLVGLVDADEDVRASEPGHFRMTNIVRLPARHYEPKGLERPLGKELSESLNGHNVKVRPCVAPV